jgi:hypothetical protein
MFPISSRFTVKGRRPNTELFMMTGEGEKRKIIFGMSTYEFFLSGLSLYKVNPDT